MTGEAVPLYQQCGRLDNHPGHKFYARQRFSVQLCVCDDPVCTCPEADGSPLISPKQTFWCTGKQVRSVEIPVTTEVNDGRRQG